MSHRLLWKFLLAAGVGCLASAQVPVRAEMIAEGEVQASVKANKERERVKSLVTRPEAASQLQAMGIAPDRAQARVDAMTDAEVQAISARLNALPAGGQISNYQLIVVILLVVIVALLL